MISFVYEFSKHTLLPILTNHRDKFDFQNIFSDKIYLFLSFILYKAVENMWIPTYVNRFQPFHTFFHASVKIGHTNIKLSLFEMLFYGQYFPKYKPDSSGNI